MSQPVVFLDFDDVICLSAPGKAGGYDAIHALDDVNSGRVPMEHYRAVWDNLFDKAAVANLLALHTEFNPSYVLSTSWTRLLNQADLSQILMQSGLCFILRSLHEDWETKKTSRSTRAEQIEAWLGSHSDVRSWVALDDEHSGDGFHEGHKRVVICEVGVGFTGVELAKARKILLGHSK
jgi:hypothetical protein